MLLIDGLPTRLPKLSSDFEARLDAQKGDVKARVATLADALDCDVSVSGNFYFLTHRYRTGNALPGITLPECAAFLHDLENILKRFRVYRSEEERLKGAERRYGDLIIQSFSESQWRMMKDEGLPIAKLSSEQERMIASFCASFYIDRNLQMIRKVRTRIAEISATSACFTSRQIEGRKVYGIDSPSGNRIVFLPLTDPDSVRRDSDGMLRSGQPIAESPASDERETTVGTISETLADAMGRSNQRLLQYGPATPGEKTPTVTVDAALAEKPLEVFGGENLAPNVLAQSVSRLYNLRVSRVSGAGEKLLLTRRNGLGVTNIGNLAPAVRRITPSPLARYVFGRISQRSDAGAQNFAQSLAESGTAESVPALPQGISFQRTHYLPDDQRKSSAAVLLAYASALDADNSLAAKPVPVSRLTPQARSAIANFVIAEIIADLPEYIAEPPAYISNLKNGTVRAGVQNVDGKKRYWLTVEAPLPGSTATRIQRSVIAVGGVAYPQQR